MLKKLHEFKRFDVLDIKNCVLFTMLDINVAIFDHHSYNFTKRNFNFSLLCLNVVVFNDVVLVVFGIDNQIGDVINRIYARHLEF